MPRIPTNEYGYFYDIRYVTVDELANYPNGLREIQDRKLDGLIVKQVLSPEEVRTILRHIEKQKEDVRTRVATGHTFPRAFFEADRNVGEGNPFENNFREWQHWREQFVEVFGIDIEKRITDVFSKMSSGKEVIILKGPNDVGSYIPLTIRSFHPNKAGIPVHCGNMFEELLPNLYSDLMQKVDTKDQMSYFIQLQTPQRGGELTLYDLEWIPGQKGIGETTIQLHTGEVIDTAVEGNIEKFFTKILPGDMIIFAAGEIWHRVEMPLGTCDRITAGGFMGFTRDDKYFTYWS